MKHNKILVMNESKKINEKQMLFFLKNKELQNSLLDKHLQHKIYDEIKIHYKFKRIKYYIGLFSIFLIMLSSFIFIIKIDNIIFKSLSYFLSRIILSISSSIGKYETSITCKYFMYNCKERHIFISNPKWLYFINKHIYNFLMLLNNLFKLHEVLKYLLFFLLSLFGFCLYIIISI